MHNITVDKDKESGLTLIKGLTREVLNLDKTFDCGQCFRWNKSNNVWVGVVGDKVYKFRQLELNGEQLIITNATIDEWDNILYDYFDLSTDYDKIDIPNDDKFANSAHKFGRGIRILKQDPWETLISFIISQRNNIPKIKSTIEKLCNAFGDLIKEENGIRYYSFPTVEKLSGLSDADFEGIGLGYRTPYIINAAMAVENNRINLEMLADSRTSSIEAVAKLESLYGVGPKVANCVALFGLGKLDMFPIDVWIQRIIDTYYNGSLNPSVFGSLAGLMQQYMFYYIKYGNPE